MDWVMSITEMLWIMVVGRGRSEISRSRYPYIGVGALSCAKVPFLAPLT